MNLFFIVLFPKAIKQLRTFFYSLLSVFSGFFVIIAIIWLLHIEVDIFVLFAVVHYLILRFVFFRN